MGVGQNTPYRVESLGIKVEGLRHLDVLIKNSMPVIIDTVYVNVRAGFMRRLRLVGLPNAAGQPDLRARLPGHPVHLCCGEGS